MTRRARVYIAGPISKGNTLLNVHNAMKVFNELLKWGYAPMCPHWSAFHEMAFPQPYETWLQLDFEWLRACDAMLRIPGESDGADREVQFFAELDKPVFHSLRDLTDHMPATIEDES